MKSLLCKSPNYVLSVWLVFNYYTHLWCLKSKVSHPAGKAHRSTHFCTHQMASPRPAPWEIFKRLQMQVHQCAQTTQRPVLAMPSPASLFIWYAKERRGAAPRSMLKYFTPHITQSGSSSNQEEVQERGGSLSVIYNALNSPTSLIVCITENQT